MQTLTICFALAAAAALWYALAARVVYGHAPSLTRGERLVAWAFSPLVFPAAIIRPCALWLAAVIDGRSDTQKE